MLFSLHGYILHIGSVSPDGWAGSSRQGHQRSCGDGVAVDRRTQAGAWEALHSHRAGYGRKSSRPPRGHLRSEAPRLHSRERTKGGFLTCAPTFSPRSRGSLRVESSRSVIHRERRRFPQAPARVLSVVEITPAATGFSCVSAPVVASLRCIYEPLGGADRRNRRSFPPRFRGVEPGRHETDRFEHRRAVAPDFDACRTLDGPEQQPRCRRRDHAFRSPRSTTSSDDCGHSFPPRTNDAGAGRVDRSVPIHARTACQRVRSSRCRSPHGQTQMRDHWPQRGTVGAGMRLPGDALHRTDRFGLRFSSGDSPSEPGKTRLRDRARWFGGDSFLVRHAAVPCRVGGVSFFPWRNLNGRHR